MKKTSPIDKMDSLKIPKGGSSGSSGTKPSGSVPITVRFNAGDECIDDIFQSFHNNSSNNSGGGGGGGAGSGGGGGGGGGGDSLSTSPSQQTQHQQNADEVNTRNTFLQGNFFNRKRSGSCEGSSPTSLGPNLIAALASGSDTNSVGTWKLIKGKVSQTIEDIKSSKSSNQTITISKGETSHEHDSDWETATIHSSISDELSLEQELKQLDKPESDSDNEYELIYEAGSVDNESARLRRSTHNVKSKVKTKSTASLQQAHHHKTQQPHSLSSSPNNPSVLSGGTMTTTAKNVKKDISPSRSEGVAAGSTRSSFLRRLKKQPPTGTVEPPQESDSIASVQASGCCSKTERKFGVQAGRKETHEIESGVEMMEDMMVPGVADATLKKQNGETSDKAETEHDKVLLRTLPEISATLMENQEHLRSFMSRSVTAVKLSLNHIPFFTIIALVIVMMLPMHEFVRGVLACLLLTALLESTWASLIKFVETYILRTMPERTKFKIPDFEVKSIFEVPAVEETKPTKTYAGWMNEVNSYDPANFHISMAESVYIKLDGTMLRVSNTAARIPKRVTWNEKPIDRKSIHFSQHRTYDLLGCRIELLPVGLASKRFFNRKYPIQLIIKNPYDAKTGEKCPNPGVLVTSVTSKENIKACIKRPSETENFFDVIDSSTSQSANPTLHATASDVRSERSERSKELKHDFAATIMNADLRTLQNTRNFDADIKEISVPCGDETRILLFARADREKEDWFRRFLAASTGEVNDQNLRLPNLRFVDEGDLQEAAVKAALLITNPIVASDPPASATPTTTTSTGENNPTGGTPEKEYLSPEEDKSNDNDNDPEVEENFEGLVMSSSAGRNPRDYIRFMALYQKSCNQTTIPVLRKRVQQKEHLKRAARREKRHEENLWKGIDQSLFLGPSGSVVWFNVIAGRFIYSILSSCKLQKKIQEYFQKKLHTVKLPSFMEEVIITEIDMGDTPPLIHRVSQAMLDERGTWVDADVTYEGLLNFTVTTKLNLMRLKKQTRKPETTHVTVPTPGTGVHPAAEESDITIMAYGMSQMGIAKSAIYDSDAESTGSSSSESEESEMTSYASLAVSVGVDAEETKNSEANISQTQQQQAKKKPNKIFKIVDRFAASNFFQYATELPYVQRAMENMNANITLRLEIKGMVSRVTINLPPPPSDRLWIGFRGPPRLWIQAKPAFGDKTVDWSFLTSVIESKICEQINKILVYPNMVDITIAFLGKSPFPDPGNSDIF